MTRSDDPPAGRRSFSRRGGDSLEQGLDRLVSAGRQLVDGVSGARPGSASRRGGGLPRLDALGRWVEDRLDWILEEDDDWREPWQDPAPSERPGLQGTPLQGTQLQGDAIQGASPGRQRRSPRRPLEAISRRGLTAGAAGSAAVGDAAAGHAIAGDLTAAHVTAADAAVGEVMAGDADGWSADDWPDDDAFSVPRWQRSAPSRSPFPGSPSSARPASPGPAAPAPRVSAAPAPPAGGRPLPRSSRRPGR